jgi:hypothetical protein
MAWMNGPSALKVSSDGYDWSGWDMSFEPLSPSVDLIDSSISFQGYVAPSLELDFQVLADLHIRKPPSTATSTHLNLILIRKSFVAKIEMDWEIYFQMKVPEIIVQFSRTSSIYSCHA